MLVVTRKLGERVFVGEGKDMVIVTVSDVQAGKVRLSFEAPRSIPIDREEVRIAKCLSMDET